MTIGYDDHAAQLALRSDYCPECESAKAGGQCATALAPESTTDRRERINEERAAFDLSPTAN